MHSRRKDSKQAMSASPEEVEAQEPSPQEATDDTAEETKLVSVGNSVVVRWKNAELLGTIRFVGETQFKPGVFRKLSIYLFIYLFIFAVAITNWKSNHINMITLQAQH